MYLREKEGELSNASWSLPLLPTFTFHLVLLVFIKGRVIMHVLSYMKKRIKTCVAAVTCSLKVFWGLCPRPWMFTWAVCSSGQSCMEAGNGHDSLQKLLVLTRAERASGMRNTSQKAAG